MRAAIANDRKPRGCTIVLLVKFEMRDWHRKRVSSETRSRSEKRASTVVFFKGAELNAHFSLRDLVAKLSRFLGQKRGFYQ